MYSVSIAPLRGGAPQRVAWWAEEKPVRVNITPCGLEALRHLGRLEFSVSCLGFPDVPPGKLVLEIDDETLQIDNYSEEDVEVMPEGADWNVSILSHMGMDCQMASWEEDVGRIR
jgi:hypothetical protein